LPPFLLLLFLLLESRFLLSLLPTLFHSPSLFLFCSPSSVRLLQFRPLLGPSYLFFRSAFHFLLGREGHKRCQVESLKLGTVEGTHLRRETSDGHEVLHHGGYGPLLLVIVDTCTLEIIE
jgi:hypothetical protein